MKKEDPNAPLGTVPVAVERVFFAVQKEGGKGKNLSRSVLHMFATYADGKINGERVHIGMTPNEVVVEFGESNAPDHYQRRYSFSAKALIQAAFDLDLQRKRIGFSDAPAIEEE